MPTTNAPPSNSLAPQLRPDSVSWSYRQPIRQALDQAQPCLVLDSPSRAKVFIVDDDPEMRESLELLLLAESFQVEAYESADAFWDEFHLDRRGCIILDLRMPGMDGLALLERLADLEHALAVIVVSASVDQGEKHRARKLGAIDVFSKPYDTKKLLATIRGCFVQ